MKQKHWTFPSLKETILFLSYHLWGINIIYDNLNIEVFENTFKHDSEDVVERIYSVKKIIEIIWKVIVWKGPVNQGTPTVDPDPLSCVTVCSVWPKKIKKEKKE